MSDENKTADKKKHMFTVTSDDFIRFLEAKTPESDCPACGFDEWTVICPSGEDTNTYRLVTSMKDGLKPMHINTFAIHCKECGYVRHHLSRFVKAWVEDNPMEPELDFFERDAEDMTHGE